MKFFLVGVKQSTVPGKHNSKQKLVGVWCDPELIEELDKARGFVQRSQWVRDAILEKLRRMGISIAAAKAHAPDRTKKSGRYPVHRPNHFGLNEEGKP